MAPLLWARLRKVQTTGGTGVPPVWRLSLAQKPVPHTGGHFGRLKALSLSKGTPMPPGRSAHLQLSEMSRLLVPWGSETCGHLEAGKSIARLRALTTALIEASSMFVSLPTPKNVRPVGILIWM